MYQKTEYEEVLTAIFRDDNLNQLKERWLMQLQLISGLITKLGSLATEEVNQAWILWKNLKTL